MGYVCDGVYVHVVTNTVQDNITVTVCYVLRVDTLTKITERIYCVLLYIAPEQRECSRRLHNNE